MEIRLAVTITDNVIYVLTVVRALEVQNCEVSENAGHDVSQLRVIDVKKIKEATAKNEVTHPNLLERIVVDYELTDVVDGAEDRVVVKVFLLAEVVVHSSFRVLDGVAVVLNGYESAGSIHKQINVVALHQNDYGNAIPVFP